MGNYIIEFNGVPGSGKSTLAKSIISKLENQGFSVITDDAIFKEHSKIKKMLEMIFYSIGLKQLKLNKLLLKLLFKIYIQSHKYKSFMAILKIIRYNGLLNKAKKKHDFIVMSEGNKQFLEVLLDDINYRDENLFTLLIKEFSYIHPNSMTVICCLESKEAIKRVINRGFYPNQNLNNSVKLEKFITNRNDNMKELNKIYTKCANSIIIDTNNSIDHNSEYIISNLKRE